MQGLDLSTDSGHFYRSGQSRNARLDLGKAGRYKGKPQAARIGIFCELSQAGYKCHSALHGHRREMVYRRPAVPMG